jgi:hypothetical protein
MVQSGSSTGTTTSFSTIPPPAASPSDLGNAYENDLRDKRLRPNLPHRLEGRRRLKMHKLGQQPFTLAGASVEKLVATLANDNLLWRKTRPAPARGAQSQGCRALLLLRLVNDLRR